jgi:outer membrane protein TolC
VGQGAQQDVLRAQVEITRFEQMRAEREADRETRLAELSRLVGREVTRTVAGVRLPAPRAPRPPQAGEVKPLELRAGAAASSASGSRSSWRGATSSPTSPCRPAT